MRRTPLFVYGDCVNVSSLCIYIHAFQFVCLWGRHLCRPDYHNQSRPFSIYCWLQSENEKWREENCTYTVFGTSVCYLIRHTKNDTNIQSDRQIKIWVKWLQAFSSITFGCKCQVNRYGSVYITLVWISVQYIYWRHWLKPTRFRSLMCFSLFLINDGIHYFKLNAWKW